MGSKKLNIPQTNFNYAATVAPSEPVVERKENPFPSMRRSPKKQVQQADWSYDLPAYQFQAKSGKTMDLPKRDDSLLGGFSNLRAGNMTASAAKVYMDQKKKEKAKEAARYERIQRSYDPFAGLIEDGDEDQFI